MSYQSPYDRIPPTPGSVPRTAAFPWSGDYKGPKSDEELNKSMEEVRNESKISLQKHLSSLPPVPKFKSERERERESERRFQNIRENARRAMVRRDEIIKHLKKLQDEATRDPSNKEKQAALSKFERSLPTSWERISTRISSDRRGSESQTTRGIKDAERDSRDIRESKRRREKVLIEVNKKQKITNGGQINIYTGPKNGKYIIKNGVKVYINSNSITNKVQYKKTKSNKR